METAYMPHGQFKVDGYTGARTTIACPCNQYHKNIRVIQPDPLVQLGRGAHSRSNIPYILVLPILRQEPNTTLIPIKGWRDYCPRQSELKITRFNVLFLLDVFIQILHEQQDVTQSQFLN